MKSSMLSRVKGQLIVSCQALENEPLHSPFIMSRMALAAAQGGAAGVRANSVVDVLAIQQTVSLPVIALIKRDYADSEVYITPTLHEIDQLMTASPEMIAMDATLRLRAGGLSLSDLVATVQRRYPDLLLMADISSVEEAIHAEKLGFDCIGTTLYGYTAETQGRTDVADNIQFLRTVLSAVTLPVIAEGHVDTPEIAAQCMASGAHAVVVGGAITRPLQITRRFVHAITTGASD